MINFRNNIAVVDIWKLSYKNATVDIDFNIIKHTAEHNITPDQYNKYTWVFNCGPEGAGPKELYYAYKFLRQCNVPSNQFRVIFSCKVDTGLLPYPALCVPHRMTNHVPWWDHQRKLNIDWDNMPMTHDITCMMRRASTDRAEFCKLMLTNFAKDRMVLSFGTEMSSLRDKHREIIQQPLPISVDMVSKDNSTSEYHFLETNAFYQAPLHVVVETSSQLHFGGWNSIFVTEKTYKALTWHQFPVWYAVPGFVAEVRNQGFDVFDDIFNGHQYDLIDDPVHRKQAVIDTVKQAQSTHDLIALRKQHHTRFLKNERNFGRLYKITIHYANYLVDKVMAL